MPTKEPAVAPQGDGGVAQRYADSSLDWRRVVGATGSMAVPVKPLEQHPAGPHLRAVGLDEDATPPHAGHVNS